MSQYLLYKKRNLTTPFVVVNENTIDSTSTSIFLIGKRTESYGQSENQSILWLLENFANTTQPPTAILGQEWFNSTDRKMYVCTNETSQTFEKVGKPIVAAVAPTGNLTTGDLWYNTSDSRLYSYNGSIWTIVGPISTVPVTAQQINFMSAITSDATPTSMFINGVTNSRLVVSANQSMIFNIDLVARVSTSTSEVLGMNFKGVLDRPNIGSVSLLSGLRTELFGKSSALGSGVTALVTADVGNNALGFTVVGQASKVIQWNAIVSCVLVTN